ncbi:helix-turn-helix domain-containing protein [Saccharopolyspora sp. 5N708]|uniref:helix-turn-helix domain-containing protein n=1 Tax=Saccharopolyspora sp. 5N708 TaxID=3457424 RepID=UPI003FCFCCE3
MEETRIAVDHVIGHLDDDLSAARLAAFAGVSERHLSRLFVEHICRTPSLVRDARLEAASQLLTGTRESVATIARRCGFASAESLRQAFVAWVGMSPSQYRTRDAEPESTPWAVQS